MHRWLMIGLFGLIACNGDTPEDTDDLIDIDNPGGGGEEEVFPDDDNDGYTSDDDCDDTNPDINPGADEICDSIDNNCDGRADEGLDVVWFPDVDEDGYGDEDPEGGVLISCQQPFGHIDNDGDCDDEDPEINPGIAADDCNDVDDDCDGDTDEDAEFSIAYNDNDNDGYGTSEVRYCGDVPDETTAQSGDCDDDNDRVNPGRPEICDEIDNNCDEQVDEGVTTTYYRDRDEDGFGIPDTTRDACSAPSGYVTNADDCDDDNGLIALYCFDSWSGTEAFQYSDTAGSETFNCELDYTTSGATSTTTLCEGCAYAFDVEITYDDESSTDDGSCAALTNEYGGTVSGDLSYTYAYSPEYLDGDPAILVSYMGDWYLWMDTVSLDEETGALTYRYTQILSGVDDEGGTYYDARTYSGEATWTLSETE
ncbi:MAG: putative metal-binding motif-containing protein [Myxococcota bacterium]